MIVQDAMASILGGVAANSNHTFVIVLDKISSEMSNTRTAR